MDERQWMKQQALTTKIAFDMRKVEMHEFDMLAGCQPTFSHTTYYAGVLTQTERTSNEALKDINKRHTPYTIKLK